MTRTKALVCLLVFVFAGAVYADVRVSTFGDRLAAEQHLLAAVQHQLVISQKASTRTRVTTVGQRCDLTRLILGVLVRVHDSQDAAPFQASLRVCQEQLALVKRIDAKTPAPPKSHH